MIENITRAMTREEQARLQRAINPKIIFSGVPWPSRVALMALFLVLAIAGCGIIWRGMSKQEPLRWYLMGGMVLLGAIAWVFQTLLDEYRCKKKNQGVIQKRRLLATAALERGNVSVMRYQVNRVVRLVGLTDVPWEEDVFVCRMGDGRALLVMLLDSDFYEEWPNSCFEQASAASWAFEYEMRGEKLNAEALECDSLEGSRILRGIVPGDALEVPHSLDEPFDVFLAKIIKKNPIRVAFGSQAT